MRKPLVTAVAAAAVVAGGFAGSALAGGFQFNATATSAEEIPPDPTTVIVSDAEAKVNIKLDEEHDSATYILRVTEPIENLTQSHLHRGAPGVNGPVAIFLYPAAPPAQLIPGTTEGIVRKGEWTQANLCYAPAAPYCVEGVGNWDAFIADLKAGNLYLNLHTTAYPPGEIRGQVHANHEH